MRNSQYVNTRLAKIQELRIEIIKCQNQIDEIEDELLEYHTGYNTTVSKKNPLCSLYLGDGYDAPKKVGEFAYQLCVKRAHYHLIKLFGKITPEQKPLSSNSPYARQFEAKPGRQYIAVDIKPVKVKE